MFTLFVVVWKTKIVVLQMPRQQPRCRRLKRKAVGDARTHTHTRAQGQNLAHLPLKLQRPKTKTKYWTDAISLRSTSSVCVCVYVCFVRLRARVCVFVCVCVCVWTVNIIIWHPCRKCYQTLHGNNYFANCPQWRHPLQGRWLQECVYND